MTTIGDGVLELHGKSLKYIFGDRDGELRGIEDFSGRVFEFPSAKGNWSLELSDDSVLEELSSENMDKLSINNGVAGQLQFTWRGIKGVDGDPEVSVKWWLEDELLTGVISYSGFPGNMAVKQILFPLLSFEIKENSELVLPKGLGLKVDNLAAREEWSYQSKYISNGTSMQFCAYLADGQGLYFSTKDPLGYVKETELRRIAGGDVEYLSAHLIPFDNINPHNYEIPYASCVTLFKGSWFEATEIYKRWAIKQSWCVRAQEKKSKRAPLDDIALWAWNRGKYTNVAPPLLKLREKIGAPVALDWYWWHRNPYDCEYPRYLPPREGTEYFKSAIKELKEQDIFTQVYINGGLLDMDDKESWEKFGDSSKTISEDGTTPNKAFNPCLPNRLSRMCGKGESFKQEIIRLSNEIHGLGLPGLYLDVISLNCNRPCYNPDHDHTPGGGYYNFTGFGDMIREIRRDCPEMLLCSESCGEYFMDLLESGIILDPSCERYNPCDDAFENSETIPIFKAVYGDSLILFGNYALIDGVPPYDSLWPAWGKRDREENWREICPYQFFLEIARTLVWGLQPTVANLTDEHMENEEFKGEVDFLVDSAKFYYENRNCLLSGQMLDPGDLGCDEIDVTFLTRMIFTSKKDEQIRTKKVPAILHSRWRLENGEEVLILANYSSEVRPFSWTCEEELCEGEIKPRSFEKILIKA